MRVIESIRLSTGFQSLPAGAVNILRGDPIHGAGGRWVPCATRLGEETFIASVFRVGPGQRQVCDAEISHSCPYQALSRAISLAALAAS